MGRNLKFDGEKPQIWWLMVAHHPQSNGHFRGCTPSNRPKLSKQQRSATWLTPSTYRNRSVSRPWAQGQKIAPGPSTFSWSNTEKKRRNSCNPGKWEQAPKKSGDLKFLDLQFIMFIIQFGQSYPTSHYLVTIYSPFHPFPPWVLVGFMKFMGSPASYWPASSESSARSKCHGTWCSRASEAISGRAAMFGRCGWNLPSGKLT